MLSMTVLPIQSFTAVSVILIFENTERDNEVKKNLEIKVCNINSSFFELHIGTAIS